MIIFFIALGAMIPVILLVLFFTQSAPKRRAALRRLEHGVYRFLSAHPLSRGRLRMISSRLSLLSLYYPEDIKGLALRYYLAAMAASLAAVLAGIFFTSDAVGTILFCLFALIVQTVIIDKQLDKTTTKVLIEMGRTLSSLEQHYLRTGSIADALAETDAGALLRRSMDELHGVLTGADGELRLQQFCDATPFRPLQTLARVCFNLSHYGDSTDYQGVSGFVRAISILRGDVHAQVEKLALQKKAFSSLEYLPLIAIVCIGPLEYALTSVIPGMALMYNGILGFTLRTLTILFASAAYVVISRINRAVSIKDDDRAKWLLVLMKIPPIYSIATALQQKKIKRRTDESTLLKRALSRLDPRQLALKKVVFAILGFSMTLLLLQTGCLLGRSLIKNTTAQLSLIAGVEKSEKEEEATRVVDGVFFDAEGKMSDAELQGLVRRHLPGLSDMQMGDEIKRMRDKYNAWSVLYFHFWFIGIALGVSLICWRIPLLMLKARAFFLKTDAEDDFMQLQTLVSILTFTGMDTLSVLEQMSGQTIVFKDELTQAYHNFPSAPEMELERLKSRLGLDDFKWFVDKLKMTISELSLADAFSGLISERESFMRLRAIAIGETIRKKRGVCSMLAMTPMVLLIVAEFVIPLAILGFTELAASQSLL